MARESLESRRAPWSGGPGTKGIEIVSLPHLVRSIRPAMDVRAVTGIYRFLKARRFDIVHTHSSKAEIVGRVAARWAGAPVIIHTPHGHVFYGYFGPIVTRLCLTLERWCARFTDRIITLTERGRREHLDDPSACTLKRRNSSPVMRTKSSI